LKGKELGGTNNPPLNLVTQERGTTKEKVVLKKRQKQDVWEIGFRKNLKRQRITRVCTEQITIQYGLKKAFKHPEKDS